MTNRAMTTLRIRLTRAQRLAILEDQDCACAICHQPIDPYSIFDVDHAHALGLGGSNEPENLRAVHPDCHRPKTKTDLQAIAKTKRLAKARELHDQAMQTRTKTPNAKQRFRARMDERNREFNIAPRQE